MDEQSPVRVAKIYELAMQSSIATIVLAFVNDEARSGFICFGTLFAPVNVPNVFYLLSQPFLAGFRFPLFVTMIIGYLIILATIVGPSSGTAVTPRYINRALASGDDFHLRGTPFVVFPEQIGEKYRPIIRGDYLQTLASMSMPSTTELLNWGFTVTESQFSRLLNLSLQVEEHTFPKASAFMPVLSFSDDFNFKDHKSWRSTKSYEDEITSYIGEEQLKNHERLTITEHVYQPWVSVQCTVRERHNSPGNETLIQVPDPTGGSTVDFISVSDFLDNAYSEIPITL